MSRVLNLYYNNNMSLYSFLIIIALFWGIGNVLVKKGFQKLTPWQTYTFDSFVIALPLWIIYGVIKGGDLLTVTPIVIFSVLFSAIVYAVFYYTISIGEISLTSSIIATYPIFTLILAFLLLEERLSFMAFIGVLLTIIGVILISLPEKLKLKLEKWVYLSIIVSIGYGVSAYLGKLALLTVNNATYLMSLAIAQVVAVLG